MMADGDQPVADVSEQKAPVISTAGDGMVEVPDDLDEKPVADVLEQTVVVDEDQVLRPSGSREEASDADWIEQSIEVPIDEDQDER